MKRNPNIFRQHFERYVFATPYCNNNRVLDLGSKDGYGANLISFYAQRVTLADYLGKSLEQAKRNYKYLSDVEFVEVDFNEKFPEGEWDTIVAFEIIEHVDDPDNLVKEIAEHLPSGGLLVFSVPHMQPNIAHKTLFDIKSIITLISKHLVLEEFYIQDSYGITKELLKNKCYVGIARKK